MKIDIERKKFMAIFLIGLLMGLVIGGIWGYSQAIKDFAEVASDFVDIDYEEIYAALNQYKSHINNCYNG